VASVIILIETNGIESAKTKLLTTAGVAKEASDGYYMMMMMTMMKVTIMHTLSNLFFLYVKNARKDPPRPSFCAFLSSY